MAETIATVGDLAGICGHDGTNWEKILIDASKRLVVAVASAVAQDAQMYGYYGGDWQKQPILRGYGDTVSEEVSDTNLPAGVSNLSGAVVPAGEVWVITALSAMYNGAGCTFIRAQGVVDAVKPVIVHQMAPTALQWYGAQCEIYLAAGDNVEIAIAGAAAGEDLYMRYAGYKFEVDL